MATKAKVKAMPHPEAAPDLATQIADTISAKRALTGQLADDFAKVVAIEADAQGAAEDVENFAQGPVMLSAQALAAGLLSKGEVNEVLIGAFGRGEPGKTGKPSKSPSKRGMYYRKRMVTLSEGLMIEAGAISQEDFPRWASDKTPDDISSIMVELASGDVQPFTAYGKLTAKERVTNPLHFDIPKLTKLVEGATANAEAIGERPELVKVYQKLREACDFILSE